jgi:hypothetical protein
MNRPKRTQSPVNHQKHSGTTTSPEEQKHLLATIERLRSPNKEGRDSLEVVRELRGYPPGS